MKIKEITIGRTINIGNYESIRIDMKAVLEDNDDPTKAIADLTEAVESSSGGLKRKWKS